MCHSLPPRVNCRQIGAIDLDAVTDLLTMGFRRRRRGYWVTALNHLAGHCTPEGFPKYGYMLESGGRAVGVILLIFSAARHGSTLPVRCNVSSWYVEPAFRSHASPLVSRALRHPATYLNVSPASHTLPIIEAQGYRRYCEGAFAAVPALGRPIDKAKVRRIEDSARSEPSLPPRDLELLRDHARFGCMSLWCETPGGGHPFVFRRRFIKGLPLLPGAHLIYCRAVDDLVRLGGPIGRFLALRGMPFILMAANGPVPGLVGRYVGGKPMYYRGPDLPRPEDLAYTESAMFGF